MNSNHIKKNTTSVWGATPAGATFAPQLTPGTKEYFEVVQKRRAEYEMPWLFDFFPFASTKDKKVLEIGCGAGYDAYEFCRNHAEYTGIDLTPENITRTQKHLAQQGFHPDIQVGDAEHLQFPDNHFDIVFSNGVLHHTPDILKSFQEAHRVVKTNGHFWLTVYYKNSIFYWGRIFLYEHLWRRGYKIRSLQERLNMIEFTTSEQLPLVNVYSKQTLKKLLKSAGFTVNKLVVRKLTKEDLPPPLVYIPTKLMPQKLLDWFGKIVGWYLVVQATKK